MTKIQARFNKGGNIKIGNMWSWSKLKGNEFYKSEYGCVLGTCGKYCDGCTKKCYVKVCKSKRGSK